MKKFERPGRALLAGLPLVVAACAGGTALQLNDVTPQSVPALQSERLQKPNDAMVATRLGVAYFRANQLPEARAVLDSAIEHDPRNGIAAIYRGMTAESQGDFAAARASYQQFITVARSNELKSAARQRLARAEPRRPLRQELDQIVPPAQAEGRRHGGAAGVLGPLERLTHGVGNGGTPDDVGTQRVCVEVQDARADRSERTPEMGEARVRARAEAESDGQALPFELLSDRSAAVEEANAVRVTASGGCSPRDSLNQPFDSPDASGPGDVEHIAVTEGSRMPAHR